MAGSPIDQIVAKVAAAPPPRHFGDLGDGPDIDFRETTLWMAYYEELAALRGAALPAVRADTQRLALKAGWSQAEVDQALARAASDFATGTHVTFGPPGTEGPK